MPVTVTQRRQAIEIAISEMTFGIEIECYIPQSVALTVGSYFNGAQVPGLPAGWVAKTDGSLIQNFPGTKGVEFVSPVLKGADGLRQVFQVCRQLRAWGCRINGSCGFHVHIGWTLPTDTAAGMAKICNLVWTVANLEGAIYAATGTKARERGTYSRSVKANYRVLEMDKAETLRAVPFDRIESMNLALSPRYHVLNLQTLLSRPGYGYKPTVEFRPFSATLNPHKMTAFIRLCLAIVGKAQAMKRRTDWEGKRENGLPVAETGSAALLRAFRTLGWTKGNTRSKVDGSNKCYGELVGEGLPTMAESIAELKRLAAKYDIAP
jgi:hypothetical protein